MDLTPYVDDLRHRLVTAADAAGEESRQLAERMAAPLDAAVRLVLLDALSTAAGEISAELAPGSVEVRLRGGDPEFAVTAPTAAATTRPSAPPTPTAPQPTGLPPVPSTDDGGTTRTTLRLPDHLKAQVELTAARDQSSVNTWLVRAVAAALEQPTGRSTGRARHEHGGSTRHTGWVH